MPNLAHDLEAGWTLPASWYTDAALQSMEQQHIFRRCWQYAGLVEHVAQHGDFLTINLGDVPVLIVRDGDGELRAFANVCRHRGATLVLEPRGRRKSIQCHYHAWTYGLNGALRAAPGSGAEPEFDPCAFSLVPLQLDCWGPFIFINPDRDAAPLSETLGDLPRLVAETGLDLANLHCRREDRYPIAANWKVVVDNYLECYHCPTAHPSFGALIDLDAYVITEYDLFSTQTAPVRESARRGTGGLYAFGEGVEEGFYAYLWPTFMINIYPGPGNVSLNLIQPEEVGRSSAVYQYLFAEAVADTEVDDFVRFIDTVQREDTVLCESVQRGLRSGYFDQGRLVLSRERALRHFQQLVYRFVEGGPSAG